MSPPTTIALEKAVALLEATLRPAAILLFGSQATATTRPDSDIDLAVLVGHARPDAFAVSRLATTLEDMLACPVDLVVLDEASPILAMDVLRAHRVLKVRDAEALEAFVVRTLAAYFDLKRVREPIERALLAERDS